MIGYEHPADRDADDVISRGVFYDHLTGDAGEEAGHSTKRGRVFGVLPIQYESCKHYGCSPVVVIDPEDHGQVSSLLESMDRHGYPPSPTGDIALALRSLLAGPKPDEPQGLGAVVEVKSQRGLGLGRQRLVRGHATREPWMGDGRGWSWDDIVGPVRVLSEGVQ